MTNRSRSPLTGAFTKYAIETTVIETALLTPTMCRIRLVAEQPITFGYTPGQHVRVQINDPLSMYGILRPAQTLRTYTIAEFSRPERTIEILAHLYEGEGIGLTWVRAAQVGDPVTVWWPQGDFSTREAPYHLFVGEETASAAFSPMIRALGPDANVHGVLESAGPEHDLAIPGPHRLHRVHRHGTPAASSPTLPAALAELDLPDGAGAAYIAGEARTCQKVRDHLVRDRHWPRTAITVKPFWTPGKYGLH